MTVPGSMSGLHDRGKLTAQVFVTPLVRAESDLRGSRRLFPAANHRFIPRFRLDGLVQCRQKSTKLSR